MEVRQHQKKIIEKNKNLLSNFFVLDFQLNPLIKQSKLELKDELWDLQKEKMTKTKIYNQQPKLRNSSWLT